MQIISKRFYTEETTVVDLQIADSHNFAAGKSKIIVHNSHIRPAGTAIKGIGSYTPGVVKFMELHDKSSEIITSGYIGNKFQDENLVMKKRIRKGAMLSLLNIRHPEIIDYITTKTIPNRLERFNMSVGITDDFMQAVIDDADWDLWFPDIKWERYDELWDGNFKKWEENDYPKVIYSTHKARDIFELITKSMYTRNEPGLYFIDNAEKFNNIKCLGHRVTSTNPCVTGDTKILTSIGELSIKEIVETSEYKNIEILSYNIVNKTKEFKPLMSSGLTKRKANIIEIELESGDVLKLTPDHKVYTENRGYVEAMNLNENDILIIEK